MRILCKIALGGLSIGLCLATAQGQEKPQPLKLIQKIVLPGVEGRFDHMSVDIKGNRLFMAALGNGTVEVIDLAAGKPLHTISGLKDPQGVLYAPESNLLFVDDGELNACMVYDGASYQLVRTEPGLKDADNIRYDASEARTWGAAPILVGYQGGLRFLDSRDGKPLAEVLLEGKPESFQVEPGSLRIFVNMPNQGYIAVVNTSKRRVIDKWPVEGFQSFFPMALDAKDHRVFIGSRNPPALVVFDTQSGKKVTSVAGVANTDDLFYDSARKRLYMSAAEGVVAVFDQRDADHYELVAKVPSVPGATTSFFAADLNRLYVAAPPFGGQPAQVLVYETQP